MTNTQYPGRLGLEAKKQGGTEYAKSSLKFVCGSCGGVNGLASEGGVVSDQVYQTHMDYILKFYQFMFLEMALHDKWLFVANGEGYEYY